MSEHETQHPPSDFFEYRSPFEYRYGSPEMRRIWSEAHKWELATRVWTAVARAQSKAGLVTDEEVADLESHIGSISFERVMEIEKETKHDVVAGIRAFAEKAPLGGRILHLGMTSEDMTSQVDMLRNIESLDYISRQIDKVLLAFADKTEETADIVTLAWSHVQPAIPTTVGYRLAHHMMNFYEDRAMLNFVRENIKTKGIKGAVGTSASFKQLLEGTGITSKQMEGMVMEELSLTPVLVSTQVYPRKYDTWIAGALAGIGDSAFEFGTNYRLLQSPVFGEWAEPTIQHK